jgi:predicted GNAT family acetyltransferase
MGALDLVPANDLGVTAFDVRPARQRKAHRAESCAQLPCLIAGLLRPVRPPKCNAGIRFGKLKVMAPGTVRDNKAKHRFELDVEGAMAFANYRLAPSTVIITHTETPRALRGRGIASELVKGALELIRTDGLKVVAGCGFVVDYLQKHPVA